MRIPIIFGSLKFHRTHQLCHDGKPLLVVHWNRSNWMNKFCQLYSKRLVIIYVN